MVVVCCLQTLFVLFDVTVCNVAGSTQGHQVLYGISSFASTHTTRFDVVDVYGFSLTDLARDEVGCVVAHTLQVDLCVVLHFW